MWIQLLMMIVSYLQSKKSGASDSQAALIGIGAGLATNYVVKNTEWGHANLQPINDAISGWLGIGSGTIDNSGGSTTVTDQDGNVVAIPPNTTPVKQPDGSIVFVPKADRSSTKPWYEATADVLKSWGGAGTAAVLATGSVVSSSGGITGFLKNNWLIVVLGLVLVLK